MNKNSRLRILIDTENFNLIKKLAKESNLTISEFCRKKLCPPKPDNLRQMIEEIHEKIITCDGTRFINSVAVKDLEDN
jgi:hypothetical protein